MATDPLPSQPGPVPATGAGPAEVEDPRRRRHLRQLLATREFLARAYTERFCHGLPDVLEALDAVIACEDVIEAQFPEAHARLCVTWLMEDADSGHEPGEFNSRCGVCRANGQVHPAAA